MLELDDRMIDGWREVRRRRWGPPPSIVVGLWGPQFYIRICISDFERREEKRREEKRRDPHSHSSLSLLTLIFTSLTDTVPFPFQPKHLRFQFLSLTILHSQCIITYQAKLFKRDGNPSNDVVPLLNFISEFGHNYLVLSSCSHRTSTLTLENDPIPSLSLPLPKNTKKTQKKEQQLQRQKKKQQRVLFSLSLFSQLIAFTLRTKALFNDIFTITTFDPSLSNVVVSKKPSIHFWGESRSSFFAFFLFLMRFNVSSSLLMVFS
ncbi:hypothetical protein VNO77_18625 [Canavalia gladiata]|uniref:Uncharacterized protein n=1 Tax=Canavalia gladiata TaxID=3824 RepID=A0AAN9QNV5_CANGL